MHHRLVILQECAFQAFTSAAIKVGGLDNEVFLADVNKLFIENKLFCIIVDRFLTTAFTNRL